MGRIWAIASGSGGVGKSSIALLLALGAVQRGQKVILMDASGLSRSCDLMLGIESTMTIDLVDAMTQQMDVASALYPVPQCSDLRLTNASFQDNVSLSEFSGIMLVLQSMCDVLVIDLPSGDVPIGEGVLTGRDELIYVLRPDDASIRSTERIMQRARACEAGKSLILNRVRRDRVKKGLQYTHEAVSMTLDCPVLGIIAEDDGCLVETASGKAVFAAQRMGNPMKDIVRQLLSRS